MAFATVPDLDVPDAAALPRGPQPALLSGFRVAASALVHRAPPLPSAIGVLRYASKALAASLRGSLSIAGAGSQQEHSGLEKVDRTGLSSVISAIEASIPESAAWAIQALRDYFLREIALRRTKSGDDFVSAMIRAEEVGTVTLDELLALVQLMFFAGSETTSSLISNGVLALADHSDQLSLLRSNPELISGAVEEVLRYDSPVQMVIRYSSADTRIGETPVTKGTAILVILGAANRDPSQFDRPDNFDVLRHPNEHLAFGCGLHFCLGAQLGRLLGRIAIATFLDRFPNFKLREHTSSLSYNGSLLSRSLSLLRVEGR
jgi:cytochrome P450